MVKATLEGRIKKRQEMARSDTSDTDDGKCGRRRFPDAVSAPELYHNFCCLQFSPSSGWLSHSFGFCNLVSVDATCVGWTTPVDDVRTE